MLTANGFCCSLVDAKEHMKEIKAHGHVVEIKQWNMASIWIGGSPAEVSGAKPPLVVGIYVGRESATDTNPWAQTPNELDYMVYVFKNGALLASPVSLSNLHQSPVILPSPSKYRQSHPTLAVQHSTNKLSQQHTPNYISPPLSELEVIIVNPFTPPKPMMNIEQYPLSKHVAHFQFTCLPTQILDVRGIAILPKHFWVHERTISKDWMPLTRKSVLPNIVLDEEAQWNERSRSSPERPRRNTRRAH